MGRADQESALEEEMQGVMRRIATHFADPGKAAEALTKLHKSRDNHVTRSGFLILFASCTCASRLQILCHFQGGDSACM